MIENLPENESGKSGPSDLPSDTTESIVDTISGGAKRVLEMPTRQVRVWHNRIAAFLSKHNLNVITIGLLLCSAWFFLSIQPVRHRALSSNPELFTDGDQVTITRVIDGDELRIENEKGSTRMRLLGIKSFDATAHDIVISEFGKVCVDYLESSFVGRSARLKISPKGVDEKGRLLGSLFVGESEIDLAMDLVAKGMTLVYLRYDFFKIQEYKRAQQQAKVDSQGLWINARVATRAESMSRLWESERKEAERKDRQRRRGEPGERENQP